MEMLGMARQVLHDSGSRMLEVKVPEKIPYVCLDAKGNSNGRIT